jgi:sugar transferase (PEP-CTERM/EpsH1 system associated)
MKILMLCRLFPHPHKGASIRPFYLIKHLSERYGYEITLLSFKEENIERYYGYELEKYCHVTKYIDIKLYNSLFNKIFYTIGNMFSFQNLLEDHIFLNYYYSPKMKREIDVLLKTEDFDAIYCEGPMAPYVENIALPKIVEPLDAASDAYYQMFFHTNNPVRKFLCLLQYAGERSHEKRSYKKFDYCTAVTQRDKMILDSYSPASNVIVIPNGVDISYFKPITTKEDFPSLIFVGDMSSSTNASAVLYFYVKIFPSVLKKYPNTKFYAVGRNPPKEIQQLSLDESVIVTEDVNDVRLYLAKASIVVISITGGTGIKNKVLEAMAMGKPVVTTSIGAQGIEVSPGKNIVIADKPKEFAKRVVELLSDEQLRQKIAQNGRRLVGNNYPWENVADMLNVLFEEIVRTNANK